MENNSRMKIIIITLVSIVVLLLIAIMIVSGLRNKQTLSNSNFPNSIPNLGKNKATEKSTNNQLIPTAPKLVTSSGPTSINSNPNLSLLFNKEVIQQLSLWIDSMRTTKQTLSLGEECSVTEKCTKLVDDKQLFIPYLWLKYNYSKIINKDYDSLEIEIDKIKQIRYQPDFWHCKLLKDMFFDKQFKSETITNINNICSNVDLYHIGNAIQSTDLIDNFKSDPIVNKLKRNIQSISFNNQIKNQRDYEMYTFYVSDLVNRYAITVNLANLTEAKYYFNQAVDYLLQTKYSPHNLALIGLSALEVYRITSNQEYYKFAHETADILSKLQNTDQNVTNNIWSLYLFKEINKIDNNAFITKYLEILKNISVDNFDYQQLRGFQFGKNAFYNRNVNSLYLTRDNILLMNLLLQDYE